MLISRILLPGENRTAIIYLVPPLLAKSSGLPESHSAKSRNSKRTTLSSANGRNFLLDLAPGGVYLALPFGRVPYGTFNITIEAVSSYLAFSPL